MRVDIINWVKVKVVVSERRDEGRSGDSPPITLIKTRVSNNNPYGTIIATLVPQTIKQQSTYANSNKSTNISSATLSLSYWMPLSWYISAYNSSL